MEFTQERATTTQRRYLRATPVITATSRGVLAEGVVMLERDAFRGRVNWRPELVR
jgi:hypothetical protein